MIPSTSFVVPPADLNIEYAVDFHRERNPQHPVLLHSRENGDLRYYNYAEVVPAIHRAGRHIARHVGFTPGSTSPPPTTVILGPINNLTFFTIILGLLRVGITGFPISPRFSANVVARLIDMVRPTHILVNNDTSALGFRIAKLVFESSGWAPTICLMPTYEDMYLGHNAYEPLPPHSPEFDKRAFVVHSSSSTSLIPKAIYWSSKFISRNSLVADWSAYPVTGKVIGSQVLEFFHSAGLYYLFWLPRSGYIMATVSPHVSIPLGPAGSDVVFQSFEDTKPEFIWVSPRLLEPWSKDPAKLRFLRKLTSVVYAGRFLNKAVGDKLVEAGVRVCTAYGSTESGLVSSVMSGKLLANLLLNSNDVDMLCFQLCVEFQGEDWEYFTVNPIFESKFVPRGDDTLEIFVASKPGEELPVVDAELNGEPVYATGDLAVAHPNKPGHYKLLGRMRDQIMLSTGEFVNPIPIEDRIINSCPSVISALVFGHGHPYLGVILQLDNEIEPRDTWWQTVDDLWPSISMINCLLPNYAQIQKHMILIASAEKPFQFTQKGAPRRPMVLADYQIEIDTLYAAAAQSSTCKPIMPIQIESSNKAGHAALASPFTVTLSA
jgi:acyl-coenzyme A synthetase/AMP-(fatty) acid ligase